MITGTHIEPSLNLVTAVLFYLFAGVTAASAWAIVVSSNIVRMAVYLLLTLIGVAGLYFLLDAELLAAIQLIVYAGGTLILIVFGVMLTNKIPSSKLNIAPWEKTIGIILAVLLSALFLTCIFLSPHLSPNISASHTTISTAVLSSSAPAVDTPQPIHSPAGAGSYSSVHTIGQGLLTTYLVPFEMAGVLLLVVMIGAAYMARRRTP